MGATRHPLRQRTSRVAATAIAATVFLLLSLFALVALAVIRRTSPEIVRLLPEYDRSLGRVVISLGPRDSTLELHHELLLRLPRYTQIFALVHEARLDALQSELSSRPYGRRVRLIAYASQLSEGASLHFVFTESYRLVQLETEDGFEAGDVGSLWAQDLFEVATSPSGRPELLASVVYKSFRGIGSTGSTGVKVMGDNSFLGHLGSIDLNIRQLPFTFMGGNLLVDVIGGRTLAFCGGDILRKTRTVSHALDEGELTDREIIHRIKQALNVEEVVVIGRDRPQPRLMYHLDQAVIFLPNRVAAVTRLVAEDPRVRSTDPEIEAVLRFLSETRTRLQDLGYQLIDIQTSERNIMDCQHYANAIPYVDRETGQRVILMPVFPIGQTEFEERLVERNRLEFESLGYEIVPVPSRAGELRGGIHCLVNVLD